MRILTLHVPAEVVEARLGWRECVAYRFVKVDEETVRLEVADDLDEITRPDGAA